MTESCLWCGGRIFAATLWSVCRSVRRSNAQMCTCIHFIELFTPKASIPMEGRGREGKEKRNKGCLVPLFSWVDEWMGGCTPLNKSAIQVMPTNTDASCNTQTQLGPGALYHSIMALSFFICSSSTHPLISSSPRSRPAILSFSLFFFLSLAHSSAPLSLHHSRFVRDRLPYIHIVQPSIHYIQPTYPHTIPSDIPSLLLALALITPFLSSILHLSSYPILPGSHTATGALSFLFISGSLSLSFSLSLSLSHLLPFF